MLNFQDMIAELTAFWKSQGCIVHQGYDLEVGAGTFNPATFLRSLGPEPYSAVYVEPSRRPQDGRYGENPNRVQFYHQMQVIMKPSPDNMQELYLASLEKVGLKLSEHDIRFVHDDWENPTIGAWGLGWEVWLDGMEVTQFTYFQAVGGIPVKPVSGEITYGLERLAMYLQGVHSIFDIKWNDQITYGEIYKRNEWEWSHYNFHEANTKMWLSHFDDFEKEALQLIEKGFPIPAFDFVMKASHAFNILDARSCISVTERTGYIARIRNLAKLVATGFVKSREEIGFPLLRESAVSSHKPSPKAADKAINPKEKQDFLLEIGSEELPATFVPIGVAGLQAAMQKLLKENAVEFSTIVTFATPRRIACLVHDLSEGTSPQMIEKKGPPLKAAFDEKKELTEVGKGFFRSLGLEPKSFEECEVKTIKEVDYLFVSYEKKGVSTRALLSQALPELILNLPFPKKMRWGSFDIEYPRPLKWLVALYGKDLVPVRVGPIDAANISYGHRQLSPQSFVIAQAKDYVSTLKKHHVMVDIRERKESIEKLLHEVENKQQCQVLATERVMPQVLHLVEWPFVAVGSFDKKYLKAPKEVLISEMVEHQRYFPLADSTGALIPQFVIICNNTPQEKIIKGNEKALSPRLSDGLFLYEEDLKVPLANFNARLKNVTFQKELGSMAAKVQRIEENVKILHQSLPIADLKTVLQAASFCKADLVSQLVGEFPELQGLAGHIFANHAGLGSEIGLAIEEHWMPRGEKTPLPKSPAGVLLSIADKIDNLLSCFSLGLLPTSSSDPYALRRQALAIIRMLIENRLHINLKATFEACFRSNKKEVVAQIEEFFLNRARSVFAEYDFAKDEIEAVLSHGMEDVYDRFCLLQELRKIRTHKHNEFLSLLTLYTRARKILQTTKQNPSLKPELLQQKAEIALFEKIKTLQSDSQFTKNYEHAFCQLAELEKPLAELFDTVKIMDEDQKMQDNRLALLYQVYRLCDTLIDFSKIQEH